MGEREFNSAEELTLIELVKNNKILYDSKFPGFSDGIAKSYIWAGIAKEMKAEKIKVQQKLKKIRLQFKYKFGKFSEMRESIEDHPCSFITPHLRGNQGIKQDSEDLKAMLKAQAKHHQAEMNDLKKKISEDGFEEEVEESSGFVDE